MKEEEELVCTLCGEPWTPSLKNRCECGGMCTWGHEKDGKMLSWGRYPFKNNEKK